MSITYEKSGVNLLTANNLTNELKNSLNDENIGKFAGIVEHPYLSDFYLASTTDGIGSKIIPLLERNDLECIATDLAAMNLNDLACVGAFPIAFSDYIATNKIDIKTVADFILFLKNILNTYHCPLVGGETSELPDLITKDYFDIGGFVVGMVKKENLLCHEKVEENDVIIGLTSNGPHSNGYTLIRKLHAAGLLDETDFSECLKPTTIYLKEILKLTEQKLVHACANITGGGLFDNLDRAVPEHLKVQIDINNIPQQPVFNKLLNIVGAEEAYSVFNMGVGFCIIVPRNNIDTVFDVCKQYNPFILGKVGKK